MPVSRLLAAVVPLVLLASIPTAGEAAAKPAKLKVSIAGLPRGAKAKVNVRGPHFKKVVKRSKTFTGVRPGRYTFTVKAVKTTRSRDGIARGSRVLPATNRVKVRVKKGKRATAKLRYGTIIRPGVRKLAGQPLSVRGDKANPSAIVVRKKAHVRRGQLLTAKPSKKLPAGLFHKVRSVRPAGKGKLLVKLRAAHLDEAFPALDIDAKLKMSPDTVHTSMARTSAFDPLVTTLSGRYFRCSFPLADTGIRTTSSFDVDADVELHIPHFGPFPTGAPSGKLLMSLDASAGVDLLAPKNIGCSATIQAPPVAGAIPVGPVVVPVYLRVGWTAGLTVSENVDVGATAGFHAQTGIAFDGGDVDNLSGASGYGDTRWQGAGRFSTGPTLRLAVGVASLADVHFDVRPAIAFTGYLDGSCSIGLVLGTQLGVSVGPVSLDQKLPALEHNLHTCAPNPPPPPPAVPKLDLSQTGPLGAFPNQKFAFSQTVANTGTGTAHDVKVVDTLPSQGSFDSSTPAGTPASPAPGGKYTVSLGDIPAGQSRTVALRWRAPGEGGSATNTATVQSSDTPGDGPVKTTVEVGTAVRCNPCGATAAGTGLRNRDHGTVGITGLPNGATVGRAVLIWGILYNGEVPPNTITFAGHRITADVTSSVSGDLCWGDSNTVGYAADVTQYVTGNGTYAITDPPRGITRVDNDPNGVLPYTDGATLVVLYNGGGANNQVISDFNYDTDTDADGMITRTFDGVNSLGGPASLTLAGPDGQSIYADDFTFTGASSFTLSNLFDGSDPQDGPAFDMGSLWDTDVVDVSSLLPVGQQTLTASHENVDDCIGVGAAVLQVAQGPSATARAAAPPASGRTLAPHPAPAAARRSASPTRPRLGARTYGAGRRPAPRR